jgi:hypothetical protein
MYRVLTVCLAALATLVPVRATSARVVDFDAPEAVLRWINGYRHKPELNRVPSAVKALSRFGALKDPENAGVYVGFMAGVIGKNTSKADWLVSRIVAIPPEDQWAVVRAVAYSTHPEWKALLRRYADRMPTRRVMIDKHLEGKLPTIEQLKLEGEPGMMDKVRGFFRFGKEPPKPVKLEPSPDVLDTFWGYYFATGDRYPVLRILALLPWSKERDSIERLTVGSMAKYTLAMNAARNPDLLALLKRAATYQPTEVAPVLAEVIEAAETADTARVRKEALAAIEELKVKGPGSKRDLAWWGRIGEGAVSLGCIAAAAAGAPAIAVGVPCVVGGALGSAGLRYLTAP